MDRGKEYEGIHRKSSRQDEWHLQRRREIRQADEDARMAQLNAKKEKAIQAKLEISQEGDEHEQQADLVAKKVVNGGDANVSQLSPASMTVQSKSENDAMQASDEVQAKLESSKGSGRSMDDATKSEMETKMGTDFSDVKIHTGAHASEMSESINAKAFTHGQDIYFKGGNYNPSSDEGKELLAHELTHTVQQKSGVQRKVQRKSSDYRLPPSLSEAISYNQKNNVFDVVFIRTMYYISGNRRLYDATIAAKEIDFAYTLLAEELQETLVANKIQMPVDGEVGDKTKNGVTTWIKNAGDYNSKVAKIELNQNLYDKLVFLGADPFPGQVALNLKDVSNEYFAYFVASLQHQFFTDKKEYTGKLTPTLMLMVDDKIKSIQVEEQNKKALENRNNATALMPIDKTATTGIQQRNSLKNQIVLSNWTYYDKVTADWGDLFEFQIQAVQAEKLLTVSVSYAGMEKSALSDPPISYQFRLDSDKIPNPYFSFHKTNDSTVNRFLYIDPYADNKTVFAVSHVMDKNKNYSPPWRDHVFQFSTLGAEVSELQHIVVKPENSIPVSLKTGQKMAGGFMPTAKATSETQLHSWQALTSAKAQLDNLLIQTSFYGVNAGKIEWKNLSLTINSALNAALNNKEDDTNSPNATALASMIVNVEPALKKLRAIDIPALYPPDVSADIIAMVEETKAKYELAIIQSYTDLATANATLGEADNLSATLPSRIANQMLQQKRGIAGQIEQMNQLAGGIRDLRDARSNASWRYIYSYLGITGKPIVTEGGETQNSTLTSDFEYGLQALNIHNESGATDTYLGSMMLMEDLHSIMGLMSLVSYYELFSLYQELSNTIFVSAENKMLINNYQKQFDIIIAGIETDHQKAVADHLTVDQWNAKEAVYLKAFYAIVNAPDFKTNCTKIDAALVSAKGYKKLASLVLTVIAALTAEVGGEFLLQEMELWGLSADITSVGATAFAAEVFVFTGEMYLGETAFGENVSFMDMLAQNIVTFGVLRGVGAANEAIFRTFANPAEYRTLLGITSTGTALLTLEGLAELQTRAATGEWMTTDQAMQTLVENIAITIGVVMGKFVADAYLPGLITSQGRYARQMEAINKTRIDINRLLKKIQGGKNPGRDPLLSLLLTETQNSFNQNTTLIEQALADKVIDAKQASDALAPWLKQIVDMELFLAQAGVQIQSSNAQFFWTTGPGEIAYNEGGKIENQSIQDWMKANNPDGFADLGNGIFSITKGAEVTIYIPGSEANVQRRVEIERKKYNGDDDAALISLRKRLSANAQEGLDIYRGENENAKDYLDRLDALEKQGKDLNVELADYPELLKKAGSQENISNLLKITTNKQEIQTALSTASAEYLPQFKDAKIIESTRRSGASKETYDIEGHPDLVISILKENEPNTLTEEIGFIQELNAEGLSGYTIEILGITEYDGRPALVSKKAAGMLKPFSYDEATVKLLNKKSIADIELIKNVLTSKEIYIDDMQVLVNTDGSVKIFDVRGINRGNINEVASNIKFLNGLITATILNEINLKRATLEGQIISSLTLQDLAGVALDTQTTDIIFSEFEEDNIVEKTDDGFILIKK